MAGRNQVDIIIRATDKAVKSTFAAMTSSIKKSKTALDAFKMSIKGTNRAAKSMSSEMKAAFSAVGIGAVTTQLWQAGTDAQRLNLAFEAIAGSTKGAKEELGYIRTEAERLGLVFYTTADAYKAIFAAGAAGNVPLETTRQIFSGFSESFAALGLNAEQVEGSLRAVSQMMGKNKVLAEELRTQLGEKLPVAIQYFSNAAGVSVAEFEKMMANGEVGIETIRATAELLSKDFGPKAEEAALLAIGVFAKWKTAWWDLKVALAESGFLDEAVSGLALLTKAIKDPAVLAALKVWAKRTFEMAGSIAETAWEWKGWIAGIVGATVAVSMLTTIYNTLVGINKGMIVLTGMNVATFFSTSATFFSTSATAMNSAAIAAAGFRGALAAISGMGLAFWAGWEIGGILNKFETVQRAGIAAVAGIHKAWLQTKNFFSGKSFSDPEAAKKEVAEMDRIYGEMFANVGKAADKTINAQDAVGKAARAAATASSTAVGTATKEMVKAYKAYGKEVKKIQDDIASREMDLASQLREMGRGNMSDIGAWRDRKAEAEEYEAAARSAAAAGDFEGAIALADKAKAAYADLTGEVSSATGELIKMKAAQAQAIRDSGWQKGSYQDYLQLQKEIGELQAKQAKEGKDSSSVMVSSAEAQKIAMEGVNSAGQLGIEILNKQKESIQKSAQALDELAGGKLSEEMPKIATLFEQLKTDATDLAKKSAEYKASWQAAWSDFLEKGGDAIWELDSKLSELTKDRHITVYVKEVVQKATGGVVGAAKMAAGGAVRSALAGFYFPGYGGGDRPKNLVMAEDGEVMLRKESVAAGGLRAALAWNNQRWDIVLSELLKRFSPAGIMKKQLGGLISSVRPAPIMAMAAGGVVAGGGISGATFNLTQNFSGSVDPVSRRNARANGRMLLSELKRMESRSS